MDKKQQFLLFVKNFDYTYAEFCVWREMNKIIYGEVYNKYLYLWTAILNSLSISFFVGLTKSVENDKNNSVLSIFYFLDKTYKFDDHEQNILDKIKKFRNKNLMHYDRSVFNNVNNFMKEVDLKYKDIELIFCKIINIIDCIKSQYGNIIDYNKYFKTIENNCKREVFHYMINNIQHESI